MYLLNFDFSYTIIYMMYYLILVLHVIKIILMQIYLELKYVIIRRKEERIDLVYLLVN